MTMLSEFGKRYLTEGIQGCVREIGIAQAAKGSPAEHLNCAIENNRMRPLPSHPNLAGEFEANRDEAERLIAGCLGMM